MVTMTPNDHVDRTPPKGCFADFMQFHVYTQSHYTVMNKTITHNQDHMFMLKRQAN